MDAHHEPPGPPTPAWGIAGDWFDGLAAGLNADYELGDRLRRILLESERLGLAAADAIDEYARLAADLLHERVGAAYTAYWAARPGPAAVACSWHPLDRYGYDELAAGPLDPWLLDESELGATATTGPMERGRLLLCCWWWNLDDVDASQVDVAVTYQSADGDHAGQQVVALYQGSRPYLQRNVELVERAESGYEGHQRAGTYTIGAEIYRTYFELLERATRDEDLA